MNPRIKKPNETMEQYHDRLKAIKKEEKKKLAGVPMPLVFRQDQHQTPRHLRRNKAYMEDLRRRIMSKNLTEGNPSQEEEKSAE